MSKGTYDVQKGEEVARRNGRDSSYGSFLCAILIFLILCVIIVIVGNWSGITGGKNKDDYDGRRKGYGRDNPKEEMEFFQKIIASSTDPPPLHTTKSSFTQPKTTTATKTTHGITTATTLITTRKPAATESITSRIPQHKTTTGLPTTRGEILNTENNVTTQKYQPYNPTTVVFKEKDISTTESNKKIKDGEVLIEYTTISNDKEGFISNNTTDNAKINDNEIETTTDDSTTILVHDYIEKKDETKNKLNSEISKHTESSATETTEINSITENDSRNSIKSSYRDEEDKLDETTTEYLVTNSTITKYIMHEYTRQQDLTTKHLTTDIPTKKYEDAGGDTTTDSTIEDSTTHITEETPFNHHKYAKVVFVAKDNTDTTTEATTIESTTEVNTMESTIEDTTTESNNDDSISHSTEVIDYNTNKTTDSDYDGSTLTESTTYESSESTTEIMEENISTIKAKQSSPYQITEPTTVLIDETTVDDTSETTTTENIKSNINNVTEYTTNKYITTTQKIPVKEEHHVCNTRDCKLVASNMLGLMDDTEDACEDFYKFACGNSQNARRKTAVWDVLFKQTMEIKNTSLPHLLTFRSFYDSCVNFHYKFSYQERVDKVKELLKSYGMESFQSAKNCDMNYIFQKLLSLNSMYFMEVGVDIGNDEYEHILQLGPSLESSGEIGPWSALRANQRRCLAEQRHKIYDADLNLEKIYGSYAECLEEHVEFRQLLRDAIEAFGYGKNEGINIHFTINYLNKLLTIRPSRAEIFQAISNKNYTIMTVGNLQKDFPQVDWKNVFGVVRGKEVYSEQQVHVYFKDYIESWFTIFSYVKEKKWLLINLLITDLYYNFVVHKVNNDVQNYCLKTSVTYFSDIASNLYVNNFPDAFINKQERRVKDVFYLLKTKFHDTLKDNLEFSEMSSYLDNMTVVFSTKREVDSDENLIRKYDDFGNYYSYQEYLLRAKEFKMHHLGDVFGRKVNAFDRNPATFYQQNKIYVPLGMVVDIPLSIPNHITLAKIGIKLAQSIAKHFDPVSVKLQHPQLTQKNSYDNLILNTDLFLSYIEKKFNEFTVKVDAALTINERMSDNTALRLLTDVHTGPKNDSVVPWISSSYPQDKVMFVAVAQEFCDEKDVLDFTVRIHEGGQLPGAVRVYNMFMNSEAFEKVFECAQGSGMNENPLKTQFPYVEDFDEENVAPS